jgi:hypothetical protein
MKVIGLIPFKNEEHFLPTYLSNVKPICDEMMTIQQTTPVRLWKMQELSSEDMKIQKN